ncbi:hypothetical protein E1B28_007268 [Marasmius oreades]|uniref:Protein Zds1 C-terminal domain-containing protein n=1 Tax=Marasmius oreades TaxID=181124 RepID=A0A9P7UT96_9AGAR|nr:uncharacterized protein E1B28_007268 [Marasmius oreades]KAG7093602.1 hypothetical protein E1B28_007268 [Marasmius oreades]
MNPSEYEIQREVEALRDIRRRSAAPGALIIDPDLPSQSTQNPYWVSPSPSTENDSSSSSSHDDASSSTSHTDSTSHREDDPLHLFWVPASVHPEIAPAEFRAFLKEHARSPSPADGSYAPSRSSSLSSVSGLGRKRSMLSRQYRPSENDGVEKEENIVPLRRNRSSIYHNQGPQLTISDLQKLEQLAEEASQSDDPSKLRTMLRRSLSLNISPTALEKLDRVPDMADEADAPIIIPPPNSIVRRSARTTKFRKPSLPGGEGDPFRGSSRRRGSARTAVSSQPLPTGDQIDHVDQFPHKRVQTLSESVKDQRFSQDSFDEALIYDAYARDEEEDQDQPASAPISLPTPPPPSESPASSSLTSLPEPEVVPSLLDALGPVINPPEAQSTPDQLAPQRTPSPPLPSTTSPPPQPSQMQASLEVAPPQHPPSEQQPSFLNTPPTPQQVPPPRKEKRGQKGIFKWGSDKSAKKQAKEAAQQQQQAIQPETREKESGFFGSLFSKKTNKDSSSSSSQGHDSTSQGHGKEGPALPGANKTNKNQLPPPPATPGFGAPAPGGGVINNYSRYPLHVERAIYRLSHIKLANPRRPLYEQVLISNLMFWYLGVINRAQGQQQQQQQQQQSQGVAPQQLGQGPVDANGSVMQENERDTIETQRRSLDNDMEMQQQQHSDMKHNGTYNNTNTNTGNKRESSPKRGPLTKPAPPGQGGRRGEMVVKGPQYDMQHRAMEQEYGGYGQQQQMGRGGSLSSWGYQQQQGPPNNQPPRLVQPVPQQQSDESPFFYSVGMVQQPQPQQRLPPGAMAPLEQSNWPSGDFGNNAPTNTNPPRRQSSTSPTLPERRSRSPPPQLSYTPIQQGLMFPNGSQENLVDGGGSGNKPNGLYGPPQQQRPARSLSATALPSASPTTNGRLRKGVSASASVPSHRGRPRTAEGRTEKVGLVESVGEEEDVPLAVYQQQRRR